MANQVDPKENEREQLLARLEQLHREGQGYIKAIERILQAAGPGNVLRHEDGSITPIEDDDDAQVISLGPSQNLHRVIGQLRVLHAKALKLGMENHPQIVQLGEALQPSA